MLTTDQKGSIAELAIARAAVERGVDVYRPVGEGTRYDLLFDVDRTLWRVQCKWTPVYRNVIGFRCYSSRRNRNGLLRRCYAPGERTPMRLTAPTTISATSFRSPRSGRERRFPFGSTRVGTTNERASTGRRTTNSTLHFDREGP
jgi:PD-(D/E)XK nuclease superfamily protein